MAVTYPRAHVLLWFERADATIATMLQPPFARTFADHLELHAPEKAALTENEVDDVFHAALEDIKGGYSRSEWNLIDRHLAVVWAIIAFLQRNPERLDEVHTADGLYALLAAHFHGPAASNRYVAEALSKAEPFATVAQRWSAAISGRVFEEARLLHKAGAVIVGTQARAIADAYCAGFGTRLDMLRSTGTIDDADGTLSRELGVAEATAAEEDLTLLAALRAYIADRGPRGPVPDWATLAW